MYNQSNFNNCIINLFIVFLFFLGTDEGDLNFEYLSNFGPRFRKLADMYGEHSSDESEENFDHGASESWC